MLKSRAANFRPLNIWLLKAGEPLPLQTESALLRTGLLAEELVSRGHNVTWWTSAWDHRHKKWIDGNERQTSPSGVKLVLLRGLGYTRNISLRRIRDHRQIAARFAELAPHEPRPDVILSSLPPYDSAAAAVDFAKERGIPVVVDLRDEWPDLFVEKLPPFLRPLGRLALTTEFQLMKRAVRGATALTSMMEGMLNWGLKHAGRERRPLDRIFYLGAHAPVQVTAPSPKLQELRGLVGDRTVVTYVGTFGLYADPRYLVEAVKSLPQVEFVFAGEGPLLAEMKTLSAGLKNVHFPGWLASHEVTELLELTHFGICPNTSHREALPNKALSFFAAGKPILCFLQGDIETITRQDQLGFCLAPGDARALQSTLKDFDVASSSYLEMCERVKRIFTERFDAENIYGEFAGYLEGMATQKSFAPSRFSEVSP